jgi:hypothetical protein
MENNCSSPFSSEFPRIYQLTSEEDVNEVMLCPLANHDDFSGCPKTPTQPNPQQKKVKQDQQEDERDGGSENRDSDGDELTDHHHRAVIPKSG